MIPIGPCAWLVPGGIVTITVLPFVACFVTSSFRYEFLFLVPTEVWSRVREDSDPAGEIVGSPLRSVVVTPDGTTVGE